MHDLKGATCVRLAGNIVISIPEQAVVDAARREDIGESHIEIFAREPLLDAVAENLRTMEHERNDWVQSMMRRLLRSALETAATEHRGAKFRRELDE